MAKRKAKGAMDARFASCPGCFVQMSDSMLKSPAFKRLSGNAKYYYICMRLEIYGNESRKILRKLFEIEGHDKREIENLLGQNKFFVFFSKNAEKYATTTNINKHLHKYIEELINAGFIADATFDGLDEDEKERKKIRWHAASYPHIYTFSENWWKKNEPPKKGLD